MVTLSKDMFTDRTNVFFHDEHIGAITSRGEFTIAYPMGVTKGAVHPKQEEAIQFLMDMRKKSIDKKVKESLTKNQLSII